MGLSTVDQAAPDFSPDGYWNGCVWTPHQWFLWKALLDWGVREAAITIPRRAADVWEREAEQSHCTFEFFRISTGRGNGYPHFAGLSSPVLAMMAAVSKPGQVTVGFDAETRNVRWQDDTLVFETRADRTDAQAVGLAVMKSPGSYTVAWTGHSSTETTDDLGCLVFDVPPSSDWTDLMIARSPE